MTLGGLLTLGYNVVVSYKRASTSVVEGNFSLSLETIDTLGETYLVLRGINRKVCIVLPHYLKYLLLGWLTHCILLLCFHTVFLDSWS